MILQSPPGRHKMRIAATAPRQGPSMYDVHKMFGFVDPFDPHLPSKYFFCRSAKLSYFLILSHLSADVMHGSPLSAINICEMTRVQ